MRSVVPADENEILADIKQKIIKTDNAKKCTFAMRISLIKKKNTQNLSNC